MRKLSIAAVVLLAAVACSKKEAAAPDTATTSTQASETVSTQAADTAATAATASTSASTDPCALFTVADATEAVGKPMERDANVSSDCQYITVDKSVPWTISAKVEDGSAMYEMQSGMNKAEQIPGLGDKAVFNPTFGQMAVVKGNREIFLGGAGPGKDAYIAAAKKILSKM